MQRHMSAGPAIVTKRPTETGGSWMTTLRQQQAVTVTGMATGGRIRPIAGVATMRLIGGTGLTMLTGSGAMMKLTGATAAESGRLTERVGEMTAQTTETETAGMAAERQKAAMHTMAEGMTSLGTGEPTS